MKSIAVITTFLAVVGMLALLYVGAAARDEGIDLQQVSNYTAQFLQWKKDHNKTYVGVEHDKRFDIFRENIRRIEAINSQKRGFTVGANKFADLSNAEFKSLYLGLNDSPNIEKTRTKFIVVDNESSIDWRDHYRIPAGRVRVVSQVKDQGKCGAGWAYSAVGALEGFASLQKNWVYYFSDQQIIDCSGNKNSCNGGHADKALEYVAANGIESYKTYPNTGIQEVCKHDRENSIFANAGFEYANSDKGLQKAVNELPVAVSVQADQDVFRFYTSGILDSDDCGTNVNHGALAVGYDVIDGKGFWIVKNSWGESWGEQGYIRIARASDAGICGINTKNVYASVYSNSQ